MNETEINEMSIKCPACNTEKHSQIHNERN